VLLLAANGLTVVNSFVGRNFMTAIADRREAEFARLAILYVGVFAASTIVAVVARFAEERLGLQWRDSLTREMLKLYLANGAYSRLASFGEVANPDQRIAEDVRALTASTLSFALMAFNSVVTILAFAGVMFSISLVLSLRPFCTLLLGRWRSCCLGGRSSNGTPINWTKRRAFGPLLITSGKTRSRFCWRAKRTRSRLDCSADSTS
jgi:putative ATP-binding cassette transporter